MAEAHLIHQGWGWFDAVPRRMRNPVNATPTQVYEESQARALQGPPVTESFLAALRYANDMDGHE